MLNWVLVIVMFSSSGYGVTSIRVSSKDKCEEIAKGLPSSFGTQFKYTCTEDKS